MTLDQLLSTGESLHSKLSLIQTETSKENVEAYQIEIDRYLNDVMRMQHELSKEIDERRAKKNALKLMEDMLKTDKSAARSVMFSLIQEKKESDFGRSSQQQ